MAEARGRTVVAGLLAIVLAACEPSGDQAASREGSEARLEGRAREVITALAERDFERLSRLIHPEEGVRFSPEAYVDEARDQVFSAEEIRLAAEDSATRTWGAWDGSGEAIQMTFRQYFDNFVYDVDFAAAESVAVDHRIGLSNTVDNTAEIYPGARFVEFHLAGSDRRYEGMDWRSLRLVFEPLEESWFLVGIVHDQWSM